MGMTIAEKILAKKSGQAKVVPGDVVTVEVDTVIMFDNNFMPSIWREIQKLHDVERIIVTLDHRVPAPTQAAAAAHATCRAFVKRFGIKRFHDIGHDQGIGHQLVADYGYALPGTVLVCSDSHTCSAGVFNCRSEEHTSELQSQSNLVCRLLLEKKKISALYKSI